MGNNDIFSDLMGMIAYFSCIVYKIAAIDMAMLSVI